MSNEVKISKTIHNTLNKCRLGILTANVKVQPSSASFNQLIDQSHADMIAKLTEKNEKEFEVIRESRTAYKLCGKEPSRYRPSAEALVRRLRTKRSLYQINNVVDTINLTSMTSQYSIGGFDMANIKGTIVCDIGNSEPYPAIGRGELNIEFMPGLRDDIGFFGTPTSDSERTMVTDKTTKLLLVFYDFFANQTLDQAMDFSNHLIETYCEGTEINLHIIE